MGDPSQVDSWLREALLMKEALEHYEEFHLYHAPGPQTSCQGFVPRPLLQGHKIVPPSSLWFGSLKPLIQAGDHTGLPEQPLGGLKWR